MDPQTTLNNAELSLGVKDYDECAQLLEAYFEWRIKGGFEPTGPINGDEQAFDILRRLGEYAQEMSCHYSE